jgi:hypothetical protein
MTEQEKADKINGISLEKLQGYLTSYDKEPWPEDKEIEFVGEAYAQMLMIAFMGYQPDRMGEDAIEGVERINNMMKSMEPDD